MAVVLQAVAAALPPHFTRQPCGPNANRFVYLNVSSFIFAKQEHRPPFSLNSFQPALPVTFKDFPLFFSKYHHEPGSFSRVRVPTCCSHTTVPRFFRATMFSSTPTAASWRSQILARPRGWPGSIRAPRLSRVPHARSHALFLAKRPFTQIQVSLSRNMWFLLAFTSVNVDTRWQWTLVATAHKLSSFLVYVRTETVTIIMRCTLSCADSFPSQYVCKLAATWVK